MNFLRQYFLFPQHPAEHAAYGIGSRGDTSCMKAHDVKWNLFLCLFFLLAASLRGRGGLKLRR